MPASLLKLLPAAVAEPDADLLGRFVAGRDEAAFAELVRRHGPAVLRVCRRLVGPSSADDAFQATFFVLACRADRVRKAGSVGSWLIGVAGRVARQMRRRERRHVPANPERERGGDVDPLARARGSPETADLAPILDDELSRLSPALRDPLVLCLVDGRTQEQAAAALGGSVRTVRRRLEQAKAVLRARLERRGVVPAVAAGLVAAVGRPSAAVSPELARSTVDGVFQFLTGGGPQTPAAVVAKGVVVSMTKLNLTAGLGMAVVVAGALALGVGLAGDSPKAADPPPVAPAAGPLPPEPPKADPNTAEAPATHRTANFVVTAPSALQARLIAAEAEYQRKMVALGWLGKELSDAAEPVSIEYKPAADGTGGETTFTFSSGKTPGIASATMRLYGPFWPAIGVQLPHEVTHVVLAAHFGKPLPRWADEGIAMMAEPAEERDRHLAHTREYLNAGRGFRLKSLFRMTEYPKDMAVLYAQGYSVALFLAYQKPKQSIQIGDQRFPAGQPGGGKLLLFFVQMGMQTGNWDQAAEAVYGFQSVDELEAAWIEWLKTPPALPKPAVPAPKPEPKAAEPERIPPTKLPGAKPTADPPPAAKLGAAAVRTAYLNSKTIRLPIELSPEQQGDVARVELAVSADGGKTYRSLAIGDPTDKSVPFTADGDGSYLVHVVVVYRNGSKDPPDPTSQAPAARIVVDTTPPVARITSAKRDGKKLVVEWAAEDANLGDAPARVQVPAKGSGLARVWRDIPVPAGKSAVTFDPEADGPVEVRVAVKDLAGNQTVTKAVTVE